MSDPLPDFFDDLNRSLERVWALIAESAGDRDSECRTPVVATTDADGAPSQRVMVLRDCDRAAHRLRFHTDSRADKVAEIGSGAPCSVLLYNSAAKIQLRLSGCARIEQVGDRADAAWDAADNFARRCYLAKPAPGTPVAGPTSGLPAELEGVKPDDDQLAPARANFAILIVEIEAIDFLYLAHQGHRRARFVFEDERWHGQWLVP